MRSESGREHLFFGLNLNNSACTVTPVWHASSLAQVMIPLRLEINVPVKISHVASGLKIIPGFVTLSYQLVWLKLLESFKKVGKLSVAISAV